EEGEGNGDDDDRVDALAALFGPVDVLQIEPEGELIERQRGADAVADGEVGADTVLVELDRDISHPEQDHDTEHEVVDVQAARGLDVPQARDPVIFDGVGDETNQAEG